MAVAFDWFALVVFLMNPESEGIRDISCSPTAYVGLGAEEAGMAAGGWLSGAGRAHTGRHYHVGSSICGSRSNFSFPTNLLYV